MQTEAGVGHTPTNRIKSLLLRRRSGGKVDVDAEDSVRFDIQRRKVIQLMRLMECADQFEAQFSLLLAVFAEWIGEHEEKIKEAYVTMQGEILAFVVVQNSTECDEQFEDELTDLEFSIANDPDLNLISLNTMPLPPVTEDALRSFIDESLLLSYVG